MDIIERPDANNWDFRKEVKNYKKVTVKKKTCPYRQFSYCLLVNRENL